LCPKNYLFSGPKPSNGPRNGRAKNVSILGPSLPKALEMEGGGAICKVHKIRLRYIKNLNCCADLITAAGFG
jgi:hypothetical protein